MIFVCRGYEWSDCRCGRCPPDLDATEYVRATTASEALGFVLEAYPKSNAGSWTITPLLDGGPSGIVTVE